MKRYKGLDLIFIFGSFGFFVGLLFIMFGFLNGIGSYSYLLMIHDGAVMRKVTSRYLYNVNLRGIILTFSFLISAVSMFLFVIYSMVSPTKPKKAQKIEHVNHPGLEEEGSANNQSNGNSGTNTESSPSSTGTDSNEMQSADTKPNNVLYGTGEIDREGMKEFVRSFPDTAIKFAFEMNINGSDLPEGTRELHQRWSERGLNRIEVKQEIQEILGWEMVEKDQIQQISVELKKQIDMN